MDNIDNAIQDQRKEDQGKANKWLVLITVAINGLIIILDLSIVNISFPKLTRVFQTEPSIILWVSVIYTLVLVGLMPVLGKIGDIYGRKKVFVLGYVIFTIGLTLCSLSQSIYQLIFFRMIQGIGSAMNMALAYAFVTDAFPTEERGKALGIMSSVFSIGPLIGLTVGGLLLDMFGWRAIFYTRVPISMIGIFMACRFLEEKKSEIVDPRLDLPGAGFLFISLSCLLLFLNMGGRQGFFSPFILSTGGIAVILFIFFILQERRYEQPVVDLKLFRIRLFTGGNISLIIYALVQSTHIFILPFYLIDGMEYSALKTGLILAVPPFLFLVFGPLAGWMSDKVGTRPLCALGMFIFSLGLFLISRLTAESGTVDIVIRLVILGMGGGIFNSPNMSQIMGAVPRENLSSVGALASTIRQIGMSSGVAIAAVIFTVRQSYYKVHLAGDSLDPGTLGRLSLISSYSDTLLVAAVVGLTGMFTAFFIGAGYDSRQRGAF